MLASFAGGVRDSPRTQTRNMGSRIIVPRPQCGDGLPGQARVAARESAGGVIASSVVHPKSHSISDG